MPWRTVGPMRSKIRFINDYQRGIFTMADLCQRHGISRKTGYKWINRFEEADSFEDLDDRSRRPHSSPTQIDEGIVEAILNLRDKRRSWGPKKLLILLQKQHPEWTMPARSTVALILKRSGLVKQNRSRPKHPHPQRPFGEINAPNDTWCIDFKGKFKTRDGPYCYPLTVTDDFTRFLLGCQSMLAPAGQPTKTVLTRFFREFGMPVGIRSDNGTPFAAYTLGRLSKLSIWWIKLGIHPELIDLGAPQQNARHERMHRTLKEEATIPPAGPISAQQRRFNTFRKDFNQERPHEGIDMKTPAELYSPSQRQMPQKPAAIEYPAHYEVRRVSKNGGIRWRSAWVNVGHVLAEEYVGLEEIDDGIWDVFFSSVWLGIFEERVNKIQDAQGKWERRPNYRNL